MRAVVYMMLAGLVAAPGLACSSYGWAEDPQTDDGSAYHVDVAPLATPAHLGLDRMALRAVLVEELRQQGLRVVSGDGGSNLDCTVRDHRSTGAAGGVVAELTLSCAIVAPGDDEPTKTVATTGLAADHLAEGLDVPTAALRADSRVGDSAVADAIDRLAPRIVDAVSESRSDDPPDQRPDQTEPSR